MKNMGYASNNGASAAKTKKGIKMIIIMNKAKSSRETEDQLDKRRLRASGNEKVEA